VKVLITGGAGFIGSHLAKQYLDRGDEVYIIDDLSTGSLQNLKALQSHPDTARRIHLVVDSILNKDPLLELVGICDMVVHLAAAVGVQYILDNPLSSIVTNIRGTENVLDLCNKFRKKVLIASTSEVYGKHDHAPLVETDDCVYGSSDRFRWSYAATKLMDEFTGLAYHRTKNLPVIVVRFFNTVGPRQSGRYGMVIPRFVRQALRGEPLTVYGDGKQTRTFTLVTEVADMLVALMETPAAVGQVINIGGTEEVTILDLAERIREKVGSKSPITLIPYTVAYPKEFEDMQRRVPSTARLRGLIGKAPTANLDAILKEIVDFFRNEAEESFA
jgi:UDP-glucose 4-epimerase